MDPNINPLNQIPFFTNYLSEQNPKEQSDLPIQFSSTNPMPTYYNPFIADLSLPLPASASIPITANSSFSPISTSLSIPPVSSQASTLLNSTSSTEDKYKKVLDEYYEKTAKIRFFETYSKTQIFTTTNIELEALNLRRMYNHPTINYLLEITNDETKLKGLSQVFEEFKVNLVNIWTKWQSILSLLKSLPYIAFNLNDLNEIEFYRIVKPILDFKNAIQSKNLLSDLETKIIITILCDSLNIFLTKMPWTFTNLDNKERDNILHLIEILKLRGAIQKFTPKKVNLGLESHYLFVKQFLYQYNILSFVEILNSYSLENSYHYKDKKINRFFYLNKQRVINISPKLIVISSNDQNDVFLYAITLRNNKLNLPISFSQHTTRNFSKINNFINVQLNQLKGLLEKGPVEDFDQIKMFPNLLVGSTINCTNTKKLELALNKYNENKIQTPKYNSVVHDEGTIYFIPIDQPNLANENVKSLKQVFDSTPPNLPDGLPPINYVNPICPNTINPSALLPNSSARSSATALSNIKMMDDISPTLFRDVFKQSSQMFTINLWNFFTLANINASTSYKSNDYLLDITNDKNKMDCLTETFNEIKRELILGWGYDNNVRSALGDCLLSCNPFFIFDLKQIPPSLLYKVLNPFLKFKNSIDNSNLFTNVEIKILMTILIQSLHIFTSSHQYKLTDYYRYKDLPFGKDLPYVMDILKSTNSQKNISSHPRIDLKYNDYKAFILLYLNKLKNVSFEKILSEFELKEARNNSNVIAYKLDHPYRPNNDNVKEVKLLIVPGQNILVAGDSSEDVSLLPLEFEFVRYGLPLKYKYKTNTPSSFFADELFKLISNYYVHSEFDRIDMYPKLLVDPSCNSISQALTKVQTPFENIEDNTIEIYYYDQPLLFIPENQPLLSEQKINSLDDLAKIFSNANWKSKAPFPIPTPTIPPSISPLTPSSANDKSLIEFYNLTKGMTLDKLKTIEFPPIIKEKWSERLKFIIEICSKPQAKKRLIQSLKYSLESTGKCHIDLDYLITLDSAVAQEVIDAMLFVGNLNDQDNNFISKRLMSFLNIQLTASQKIIPNHTKLDYSLIDLNELSELIYNYYIDSLKMKASNPDCILKVQRYDFSQTNREDPLFQYKDLLPPIAKPCFYLVRPPEEENPEIHCFQIYMNEVYDIYAIGKDTPENEVSSYLATILGIDRKLLLPSSYGEGFSLKNHELDLLWKYYAAHPEEFILLSSLSMQSQDESNTGFPNSVKRGKTGKRRLLDPNSEPIFPDKLKAKRQKHNLDGPDLDEDAPMVDPSPSSSLPFSENEGSQNPNAAQLAVLPSMPLTSSGYKLPEINFSNPFASLMFNLTKQSMEFIKKHLEKVEKHTLKSDDQLFSITSFLRQKIGVQTHTISQFYCASLKEYQQDSASWMLNMSKNGLGGVLASEPGLGKTLTAIEWIMQQQKRDSSHRPMLIVVPKTIASQWRESLYQQNQNWVSSQFAQLIQKAKEGSNIDLATLCQYLNLFLQSHLTEILVLEKKIKEIPSKVNGEDNPMHSYVKLQLDTRQKWLQEAQSLYDDLFFNVSIMPHVLDQWKKEINQRHLSQEDREKFGRKLALLASNFIEKIMSKDLPDWDLRVEKGLKAFSLFKYGKLLNALKLALQQKNLQEIRAALSSYLFQYNEDVQNLGNLLVNLFPLSQPTLSKNLDSAIPISPEVGIRANFYSLVNVISEPPKSYAELAPLKVNIEKPYAALITTKDTLRVLKKNNQSSSKKALDKRKEKENFIEFLKTLTWGGVIWDEAQLQVWDLSKGEGDSETSFAYRFLKGLSLIAGSREMPMMLLTGTPFVNTYGDTLSLLSMANPNISLQSYGVEILNRESRLKIALESLERAKKIQIESQEKNEASIKRSTRSFLKCLENVIVAYAHMKKVQANLVRINRFDDQNVQQSWTTEEGVKLLPQKQSIEITCALKPKQKELIRSIQQGFKSGEKSLFRLLDSSHKIVFHPDLNGKKLVDRSNPELEAIKKKIKAFNYEEQNKFIDESGFLTAFFKGSETTTEQPSFQVSPFKAALQSPESILIIVSRIFEGVILKQLLENQFKYENRVNAKVWFFDGSATTEQREHMVRAYETSPYFSKIFILSVKSGGVGLDLKSTTIGFNLASKWAQWNNSGLLQAEARMYRANTMGVKRMYTFNTGTLVEQCVHHAVVGKRLFSQFLFYSNESIKKEIELYLNVLEARCIKTEVDLSIENMEERKAKIYALFDMVRKVVEEAPPKYFDSFQKRLSMATDLNYNLSQETMSRSNLSPKMFEKVAEGGIKRKSVERVNEVNKGKKKKTGVLSIPSSNTEITQPESKSSLPQGGNHSSAAAPLTTVAGTSLTMSMPASKVSMSVAHSFESSLSGVGNVTERSKKYNSFSNRVANFNTPTFLQPKLSQSGPGTDLLKTHYEVGVSGGNKINLSVVPLRDCFDVKQALQIGVGVSKNGQKMGGLLKSMRALSSQEWQSLLEDPEAFMKTSHQNHDLNVTAVKTLVPTLFGIEQHASQSSISQEEILKNYNSDIYVFKDGKLIHEKGLRATQPSSMTCTIRLLKLPLAGSPNRSKFHLLMK